MTHSTIMQRLTLLTAVPVIALMLSSGTLIWNSYEQFRNAGQAQKIIRVAVASGELVHHIQIERGMTAGFIPSGGQKFSDTLPLNRMKTDEKLTEFKHQFEVLDLNYMPELKKATEEALQKLDGLAGNRDHANKFNISVVESSAFYTDTIALLMDVMSSAAEYNKDPEIARKLVTYHAFANAKENAGQERALCVPMFVANKVEPAQFRNIVAKIYKQEAYLDSFTDSASTTEKVALQDVFDTDASKEVQRMRNIMAERYTQGGFDVNSETWFKASTDRINGLHEVEQLITKGINDEVKLQQTDSRKQMMLRMTVATLVISIAIMIAIRIARSVNRSLKGVVTEAEYAVMHDDFTRKVPEEGTEETARVGQAINRLMNKFRNIITQANQSSADIADASGTLSASSSQVSRSSSAQADAASTVAAAVEEVSVSVSETAANAHTAGEIVEKTRASTERALTVMAQTVNNVNGIAVLVRESDTSVAQLGESSKKIGGIVQVIKEVADQTNLLALNAAIEAARAGEQGRGFAVVADEVRKLAERTSNATTEIASLISDIQSRIGGTIEGMHKANSQVEESLILVGKTEAALHHIGDDSREAASKVQSIADAVREQDIAIQQVAANIEKIAQMAEENSLATASSSDTAVRLDGLSSALKDSVARFKV